MNFKQWISGGMIGLGFISIASAEPLTASAYIHDARAKAKRIANIDAALAKLEADAFAEIEDVPAVAALDQAKAISNLVLASAKVSTSVPDDAKSWARLGLDFEKAKEANGKFVQTLANGWTVEYTVEPAVQKRVQSTLEKSGARKAAVVLTDPETGFVRAYAGVSAKGKSNVSFATKANAPSASVFKVITAAALIDDAELSPKKTTCYHGGRSYLSESNIKGNKRYDKKCASIESALAFSINSVFAKLAYYNLKKETLTDAAERFGYNKKLPFEFPVDVSKADFPANKLERARAAAGFRHTYLSPLHASMISGAVANGGKMMRPRIVKRVLDHEGLVLFDAKPEIFSQVAPADTAETLWTFMQSTTTKGTARRYFRSKDFDGTASGKTGTLSDQKPVYTQYSWFSGSAEVRGERVAVGALVCNPQKWRIKGAYAAREALRAYFAEVPPNG